MMRALNFKEHFQEMGDRNTFLILNFLFIHETSCSPFAYDREYGHGPTGVGVVSILSTLLTCCCCIICYAACISWCMTANRNTDNDDRNVVHVIHSPPPTYEGMNHSISPRRPVVVRVTEYHIGEENKQATQLDKEQKPKIEQSKESLKTSTSSDSSNVTTGSENKQESELKADEKTKKEDVTI